MPAEYSEDLEPLDLNRDRVLREKVAQLIESNNDLVRNVTILRGFATLQLRANAEIQERLTTLEALVKT